MVSLSAFLSDSLGFCRASVSFFSPELSPLPSLCLLFYFYLPFSFPFPISLSPLCVSTLCMNPCPRSELEPLMGPLASPDLCGPPAGLTTPPPPARGRLRCYTCSFAKPCYPVPTECQDDEACGISIGTSGRTWAQWPFSQPISIHPSTLLSLLPHSPCLLPSPGLSILSLSHRAE